MYYFKSTRFYVAILVSTPTIVSMTTAESNCPYGCFIDHADPYEQQVIYGWRNNHSEFVDVPGAEIPRETWTMSIITIVNTVQDTTILSTKYDDGYVPPATNSGGTRVQTITYNSSSKMYTTVMTYPSLFIVWPEKYAASVTKPTCLLGGFTFDNTNPMTFSITSTRQPEPSDMISVPFMHPGSADYAADLKGTGYMVISDTGLWAGLQWSNLLPDQPAFTSCTWEGGPNWGGFTSTSWFTKSSTSYMGEATTNDFYTPSSSHSITSTSIDIPAKTSIPLDSNLNPTKSTTLSKPQNINTSFSSSETSTSTSTSSTLSNSANLLYIPSLLIWIFSLCAYLSHDALMMRTA